MSSEKDRWGGPVWPFQSKADALYDLMAADNDFEIGGALTLAQGGTVTQITSITTAVTLNTITGQITTVASTLAAGAEVTFQLTNSNIAATDVVIVNVVYGDGDAGEPVAFVTNVEAGSCDITLSNLHAANALDATVQINFAVIKGASS